MWVLGTNTGLSSRAASVRNPWAIYPFIAYHMTPKLTFTPRAFILCNFYLTELSLEMLSLSHHFHLHIQEHSWWLQDTNISYRITLLLWRENFIANSQSNFYILLHTWSLTRFSVTSITVWRFKARFQCIHTCIPPWRCGLIRHWEEGANAQKHTQPNLALPLQFVQRCNKP